MTENCFCKNCNAGLQGAYCHACGQKASTGRLTIRAVLQNMFHGIFHCDRNILYTCYALFTRPGRMIADYIAGCRIRYFNPFTMLIITAGIATLLREVMLAGHVEEQVKAAIDSDSVLSRLLLYAGKVTDSPAFSAILLILPFALAAKWAIGKKSGNRYNYMELLVAGVYIACQCLAAYIVIGIPTLSIFGKTTISNLCILSPYFALLVWDCKQLFQLSVIKSVGRVLLMHLHVFLIFLGILVMVILLDLLIGFSDA